MTSRIPPMMKATAARMAFHFSSFNIILPPVRFRLFDNPILSLFQGIHSHIPEESVEL
jgi:hypothetical protein